MEEETPAGTSGGKFVTRVRRWGGAGAQSAIDRRAALRRQGTARGCARGPRPLEVEAAQVPGNIDDFADEKQPRDFSGLHRLAGKFFGVHATGGDFGFFVPFGIRRRESPFVNFALEIL